MRATGAELQGLLVKIIARLMKMLTRQGYLLEEQGMTYWADIDPDNPLRPLQAASCTYRIALGPRAGHKVLSLQTLSRPGEPRTPALCANAHGFSLHAGRALWRQSAQATRTPVPLYHPPRHGQRTVSKRNRAGQACAATQACLRAYPNGTTYIVMSAHGIHAAPRSAGAAATLASDRLPRRARPPRPKLRAAIVPRPAENATGHAAHHAPDPPAPMSWARLTQTRLRHRYRTRPAWWRRLPGLSPPSKIPL